MASRLDSFNDIAALLGLCMILTVLLFAFSPVGADPGSELDAGELEGEIHDEVNEKREANGLNDLRQSDRLSSDATDYSERMVDDDFFSHTTPEGLSFAQRARCEPAAENLNIVIYDKRHDNGNDSVWYRNQEEVAEGVVTEWMNSEGHRRNILDARFTAQGIGVEVTEGPETEVVVTQQLC